MLPVVVNYAVSVIALVVKGSAPPHFGTAVANPQRTSLRSRDRSATIQLCAIDDAQCRDERFRGWLQEHMPEQVEERMEALGAVLTEWQPRRHDASRAARLP